MKERFLLVIVVLALASGAALADGYIADVPDANQPPANPLNVAGFVTSNYCAPFAAVNITEYWDAKGAAGPSDDVDGNPSPGGTSVAQYIGWWMNTNDDANMSGCPYRVNGDQVSKSGTLLADIPPGLVQFAEWDANCTFGCASPTDPLGPSPMAGKQGYRWTVASNQNLAGAWNQIKSEIDAGRPLIVVWNYWNPTNKYVNPDDGYSYYLWGAKVDQSQGAEDPVENWSISEELGHAVTAVGYKQGYDPDGEGPGKTMPLTDWVIVHDNWSTTDCDVAIPFAHQNGNQAVWMANVTVDPNTSPAQGILTVSAGGKDPGNHPGCIGGAVSMCQINLAADGTEDLLVNALTLVAGGTGNDQTDIIGIDIVKDNDNDGAASVAKGDKVLATFNGGYPQDNGTRTIPIPGNWASKVLKNGSINLIVVHHLKCPIAQGLTFTVQVSAVYATGYDAFTSAQVNGAPYNSGTITSDDCLEMHTYDPPLTFSFIKAYIHDGRHLILYAPTPVKPKVSGSGSAFGNRIYLQDPTIGGVGIALDFTPSTAPTVTLGQEISQVEGRLYTVNGERTLVQAQIATGAFAPPTPPVIMSNAATGGGDWFYDPITGAGQKGVSVGVGLNNIGTLVKTTGRVTQISTIPPQPYWFKLNDGSGVEMKVLLPTGVSPPGLGYFVCVTGVCSTEVVGSEMRRVIRLRTSGDLQRLRQP